MVGLSATSALPWPQSCTVLYILFPSRWLNHLYGPASPSHIVSPPSTSTSTFTFTFHQRGAPSHHMTYNQGFTRRGDPSSLDQSVQSASYKYRVQVRTRLIFEISLLKRVCHRVSPCPSIRYCAVAEGQTAPQQTAAGLPRETAS